MSYISFVRHRILSVIKTVEFVSDRMSYIIPKGRMFFYTIFCTVSRVYLLCEFKILPWLNWYIIFQTNGLNVWNVELMMWSEPSPAPSDVVRKTFWSSALLQSISSNTFITASVTHTHTHTHTRTSQRTRDAEGYNLVFVNTTRKENKS
jgi:hypothetical protein